MKLIIAEKPSVAKEIAAVVGADQKQTGYLEGNGYLVSWCVGHLLDSAPPEEYDPALKKWSLDTLPILPENCKYTVVPSTAKRLKELKVLMDRRDVDRLICATDAGREGEHIFRLVYEAAGCRKPWDRLWTSSLEPAAIRKAMNELQPGHAYDDLAAAARCRQQADWYFGINLTRLYTCLYKVTLNTGRVQSPTLAMIVLRQDQIDRFTPEPYAIVTCSLADRCEVRYRFAPSEADEFLAASHTQARITKAAGKLQAVEPPRLYDLDALQQEANRLFGYSAAHTLADLQILYEEKLATYPRTESRFITGDMEESVGRMIQAFQSADLLPQTETKPNIHRLVDSSKVQDHPALLPTAGLTKERLEGLPTSQKRLMLLLLLRLLEATAPPWQYYMVELEADIDGVPFSNMAKSTTTPGWKQWRDLCLRLLEVEQKSKEDGGEQLANLSGIQEGDILPVTDLRREDRKTQPPKPYTEATLISAMKNAGREDLTPKAREAMKGKGLGTAATRAAIIDSLVSNGYITREKRYLRPTEKARTFIPVLVDRLKDPVLTAEWETKLYAIEHGEGDPELFLQEVRAFLRSYIQATKENYQPELYSGVFSTAAKSGRTEVGKCPLCGSPILEYPKSYGCSAYKEKGCKFTIWKNIAGKELSASMARSLLTNGKTRKLEGFRKRDGTTFDAVLELRQDGTVGFAASGPKKKRGGPAR